MTLKNLKTTMFVGLIAIMTIPASSGNVFGERLDVGKVYYFYADDGNPYDW